MLVRRNIIATAKIVVMMIYFDAMSLIIEESILAPMCDNGL